jgi:hypothetical protein
MRVTSAVVAAAALLLLASLSSLLRCPSSLMMPYQSACLSFLLGLGFLFVAGAGAGAVGICFGCWG